MSSVLKIWLRGSAVVEGHPSSFLSPPLPPVRIDACMEASGFSERDKTWLTCKRRPWGEKSPNPQCSVTRPER